MPGDIEQLIVQREGNTVQTVPLTMGVLAIGRDPDNGLVLPDPTVSRKHAELRLEPAGPKLTDLGSSRGTFVAGRRIPAHDSWLLTDGVTCQIGPYILIYRAATHTAQTTVSESAEEKPAQAKSSSQEQGPASVAPLTPPPPPRPRTPASLAQGPGSRYLSDLPVIFHDQDFLGRFLLIFESIWEPLEQRQDHIAMYFDPRTCPASFLPWLAGWIHLALDSHWSEARCRRLLAEAMDLYRWRGTHDGLTRMIKVCTGLTPEITEDPSQPFILQIRVSVPPGSDVRRELLEGLIKVHKPAHVGYRLEVES